MPMYPIPSLSLSVHPLASPWQQPLSIFFLPKLGRGNRLTGVGKLTAFRRILWIFARYLFLLLRSDLYSLLNNGGGGRGSRWNRWWVD